MRLREPGSRTHPGAVRKDSLMFGTRPLRVALTGVVVAAAAVTALTLASCASRGSGGSGSGSDPGVGGATYSGQAHDDARVVLDALGDHVDLGVCARKDPESVDRSWSAPLVAVPAALLDGNAGCGQHVAVSNGSGTTVVATVVGSCDSCSGQDISLSPELFHQLASFGQFDGGITVTWRYAP